MIKLLIQIKIILLFLIFIITFNIKIFPDGLFSGEALIKELKSGGYIIYFRHSLTNSNQDDYITKAGDWTSCDPAKMRQLTDRGRTTARRIGELIRLLEIPVDSIYSSEYCRARETAELLNLGSVITTLSLMNLRAADMTGGIEKVVERAILLIEKSPEKGKNKVYVAHGNLMQAVFGVYTVEAGAGVFKSIGNGKFKLNALIEPDDWETLYKLMEKK